MTGTPGPAPGFEHDKPTLDLGKDFRFEEAQKLRKELVYDPSASLKTMDLRFATSDPYTDFKSFAASSEMNKDTERLDNDYKQGIKSEYDQAKSLEKIIIANRKKIAA